ncbi:MAG: zinc-binding alcohol dehydrogenase [Spirochaetales bacterium]|nr:MAG: zinc-binding alcohol dehydrogenase [Spirochaetales bacterium]
MTGRKLYFTEPYRTEIKEEELPPPGENEIVIRTLYSAISAGTESLFFSGNQPELERQDRTISCLAGPPGYPLSYGYSLVGEVVGVGGQVPPGNIGRHAFAFHPHQSHAVVNSTDAVILPMDMDPLDALFLPSMETAVTLVMDGAPLLGERVAVLGLGIVGLLTVFLLSGFPLDLLLCTDPSAARRKSAEEFAPAVCFSGTGEAAAYLEKMQKETDLRGVDLCYELSGNPRTLDEALSLTGFNSRICIGSWYGKKTHPLALGGGFHRDRIKIFSSQVSTIAPEYTGRWNRVRRFGTVLQLLQKLKPGRFISHRFPLEQAQHAYDLIMSGAENLLQVVFVHKGD